MIKAHAYLRVSGKGQVERDGFTRQLRAIREYAAGHDIKIEKVFREEGVSGTMQRTEPLHAGALKIADEFFEGSCHKDATARPRPRR